MSGEVLVIAFYIFDLYHDKYLKFIVISIGYVEQSRFDLGGIKFVNSICII